MVLNSCTEKNKSITSFASNERKSNESETSIRSKTSDKTDTSQTNRNTAAQQSPAVRSKSTEPESTPPDKGPAPRPTTANIELGRSAAQKPNKKLSLTSTRNVENHKEEGQENPKTPSVPKQNAATMKNDCEGLEMLEKLSVSKNSSFPICKGTRGLILGGSNKIGKSISELQHKKPSEIPKLKSLSKATLKNHQRVDMMNSRLPIKTVEKESGKKDHEGVKECKSKSDSMKTIVTTEKEKKTKIKIEDKITADNDVNKIVPFCEKKFRKITDAWVNTIYCSLTMRGNLINLLFETISNINKSQFHAEDEKLNECVANAKNCTMLEAENIIKLIKTIIANPENGEAAELCNQDWLTLSERVVELEEETRRLQKETTDIQRKKEDHEVNMNEKIQKMKLKLRRKEEEVKKLSNELNHLHQKEGLKPDSRFDPSRSKEPESPTLVSVKKEFEELKVKFAVQSEKYEKKIKTLELLLEEKTRVLEREKETKNQLQRVLNQFQEHQKRLIGNEKEQFEYLMGRTVHSKCKRREQLWLAAVKLVLKGFLIQMDKLEKDRNKLLLELQSNDLENFSAVASIIIQKDNFIKSIKNQMNDFQKVCSGKNKKISNNLF